MNIKRKDSFLLKEKSGSGNGIAFFLFVIEMTDFMYDVLMY